MFDKGYAEGAPYLLTNGGTNLSVMGTRQGNIHDIFDDIQIPLNNIQNTARYKQIKQVMEKNPQIQHVRAHSLGSAIVNHIIEQHPNILDKKAKVTLYNAPVVSGFYGQKPRDKRITDYSNDGDIISILDRQAIKQEPMKDPWASHFSYDMTEPTPPPAPKIKPNPESKYTPKKPTKELVMF